MSCEIRGCTPKTCSKCGAVRGCGVANCKGQPGGEWLAARGLCPACHTVNATQLQKASRLAQKVAKEAAAKEAAWWSAAVAKKAASLQEENAQLAERITRMGGSQKEQERAVAAAEAARLQDERDEKAAEQHRKICEQQRTIATLMANGVAQANGAALEVTRLQKENKEQANCIDKLPRQIAVFAASAAAAAAAVPIVPTAAVPTAAGEFAVAAQHNDYGVQQKESENQAELQQHQHQHQQKMLKCKFCQEAKLLSEFPRQFRAAPIGPCCSDHDCQSDYRSEMKDKDTELEGVRPSKQQQQQQQQQQHQQQHQQRGGEQWVEEQLVKWQSREMPAREPSHDDVLEAREMSTAPCQICKQVFPSFNPFAFRRGNRLTVDVARYFFPRMVSPVGKESRKSKHKYHCRTCLVSAKRKQLAEDNIKRSQKSRKVRP